MKPCRALSLPRSREQLHGLNDPLIPFDTAQWLRQLLATFSDRAVFMPHGGGHDIPPRILGSVSGFLSSAFS